MTVYSYNNLRRTLTQTAHGFKTGNLVRHNGTKWVLSQADNKSNCEVVGIVSSATVNTFTIVLSGFVENLSGLTPGKMHYLNLNGGLTSLEPAKEGQVIKPLLLADSKTSGFFVNQPGTVVSVTVDQAPAPSPTPSTTLKVGMNIGHQMNGLLSSYPLEQNTNDLNYLWDHGVRKVRIKLEYHLDSIGIGYTQRLALQAKAKGFHVTWGITGGAEDDDDNYRKWIANVPTAAKWAQENAIDQFQIGNEEDWNAQLGTLGSQTGTSVRNDVKSLVSVIKGIFKNGPVIYSSAQGTIAQWRSEGTGSLDRIGFNMYDRIDKFDPNMVYFKQQVGDKFFVTEWACEHPFSEDNLTPEQYKAEIAARRATLLKYGLDNYFHTWRDTDNGWGIRKSDNSFGPGINELLST